ncbi:hypothetical protein EZV73_08880 [Acidaminobacter sp. JC074]|uniref:hypothetical protein n=1 Tax=Acidaminobacter sp. JC074 TaxID=2530199 RepID=UPI001F118E7D|nr:hypothetical protein [Acidaminobacter sp. JC074]MCH4887686.1 hypothetical protein [Acidaminobacter sp. JC074]
MKKLGMIVILILMMTMVACSSNVETSTDETPKQEESGNESVDEVIAEDKLINESGVIYLYGEYHGYEKILNKELEMWKKHYKEDGMRHLFIESPYFKAQLLNIWMTEETDDILHDVMGTNGDLEAVLDFYKSIKTECPETVFHGTDVNGYKSYYPGIDYRKYLEDNKMVDSEAYRLNELAIAQVKEFQNTGDDLYREEMLVENFIREFNALGNESVMGIYGLSHVKKESFTKESYTVNSMAMQLSEIYGDRLVTVDLSGELLKGLLDQPLYIEELEIGGKLYEAEYYGNNENTGSEMIKSFDYYKLLDAYEDFKDAKDLDMIIPAHNYPMIIEENNVYLIVANLKDQTIMTYYTIADGTKEDGFLVTKQVQID